MFQGLGFVFQKKIGFRIDGLGFRVQGSYFKKKRFMIDGLGFRVEF